MSRRITWFGGSRASGPVYQPETIAYMTAVGIPDDANASIYGVTNNAVWLAWDAFFVTLKGAGLLSKHYYIRGMTGAVANAANYKFNAINPVDADAAYRAVYYGGVTFSATGTHGNGTNGYANSFFNDQTAGVATDNFGMTSYLRAVGSNSGFIMGSVGSGTHIVQQPNSGSVSRHFTYDNGTFTGPPTPSGAITNTRNPSETDTQRVYNDGVLTASRTSFAPTALTNLPMFEMARNLFGSPNLYSDRELSYHAVHTGMTAAEVVIYHAAIQTLQTALNRQA